MVQYGAIDHVPSYNLSRGVVLFFPNCATHVVPPLTHARLYCIYIAFPATVLCVHKQLPGCTVANTWPACNSKPLYCGIPAPAIMLLAF